MPETTSSRNEEISMNPSDQCRLWTCNFKIKFDNFKENIFNPSKRKNCKGEVLALPGWQLFKSLCSDHCISIQSKISKSSPTKLTRSARFDFYRLCMTVTNYGKYSWKTVEFRQERLQTSVKEKVKCKNFQCKFSLFIPWYSSFLGNCNFMIT